MLLEGNEESLCTEVYCSKRPEELGKKGHFVSGSNVKMPFQNLCRELLSFQPLPQRIVSGFSSCEFSSRPQNRFYTIAVLKIFPFPGADILHDSRLLWVLFLASLSHAHTWCYYNPSHLQLLNLIRDKPHM